MKKEYNISYEEIFYASTQKSAVSGSIGFGVRTFTEGMPTREAEEISALFAPGYPLPTSKTVTQAQLQQNPDIVLEYPRTFEYRDLTLGDGSKRYVLARTVYVGIEYGYFCNGAAKRAGSNFFTHMLVFRQVPPFELINDMIDGRICMPHDGSCRPDNHEWQMLLTGEPQLLPQHQSLIVETVDNNDWASDPRFLLLAKAMLQSYMNEKMGKDPMLHKVMIKTTAAEQDALVRLLSHIPDQVMAHFPFSSNVMKGTMPSKYRVAFMNDWNTTQQFPDNYVYVDFTSGKTSNIENNFLFSKMDELVAAHEPEKLRKLLVYFLGVDYNNPQEYPFVYDIFLSVQTSDELPLAKIDNVFIDKVMRLSMPQDDAAVLWNKINIALNRSLSQTISAADMITAIKMNDYCRRKNCPLLHIDERTIEWMTSFFFGKDNYLNAIASKTSPEMMLPLLNLRNVDEERFFDTMRACSLQSLWQQFVRHYYGDKLSTKMDRVLSEMVASKSLQESDREQLCESFYPQSKNANQLLAWFAANPDAIVFYKRTVSGVCSNQQEEKFSMLINASQGTKNEVATVLAKTASDYYGKHMKEKKTGTAKELVELCNRISKDVFVSMRLDSLFKQYADHLYAKPSKAKNEVVKSILDLGISSSSDNCMDRLNNVYNMLSGRMPSNVNFEDLQFDIERGESNDDFSLGLFKTWLDERRRSADDVQRYASIAPWSRLSKKEQQSRIETVWTSKMEHSQRVNTIMWFIHCAGWKKEDINAFMEHCNRSSKLSDLATAIAKENTFFKKVVRFFKSIGKKKGK